MSVTDQGKHLVVYLTALRPQAEAELAVRAAPGVVTFAKTAHTRAQLLALHIDVTRSAPTLASEGIRLVSWFPGINGDGMEHIGILNLTAKKAEILRERFGPGNLVLTNVAKSNVPQATNRNYDYAPWNGGDNLTSHGIGCTSGVGIEYNGAQYMITAAHCYQVGWSVYNEFQ
ncbi:MAG TPA: hypothetical protein VME46_05225, partial [Acidimicrobiales bacterium]|nr:hypothetical protein [Acidimicrobiales bacterium]